MLPVFLDFICFICYLYFNPSCCSGFWTDVRLVGMVWLVETKDHWVSGSLSLSFSGSWAFTMDNKNSYFLATGSDSSSCQGLSSYQRSWCLKRWRWGRWVWQYYHDIITTTNIIVMLSSDGEDDDDDDGHDIPMLLGKDEDAEDGFGNTITTLSSPPISSSCYPQMVKMTMMTTDMISPDHRNKGWSLWCRPAVGSTSAMSGMMRMRMRMMMMIIMMMMMIMVVVVKFRQGRYDWQIPLHFMVGLSVPIVPPERIIYFWYEHHKDMSGIVRNSFGSPENVFWLSLVDTIFSRGAKEI